MMTWIALALAAQDLAPEPLDRRLETWYRIAQGEDHAGFAHETVEIVRDTIAYSYELETDLATGTAYARVRVSLEAVLDRGFEIRRLRGSHTLGAAVVRFEYSDGILQIKPDRRIETGVEALHFLAPLSALILRQQGRLDRAGRSTTVLLRHPAWLENAARVRFRTSGHREIERLEGGKAWATEVEVLGYPATTKELVVERMAVDRWGRAIRIETPALRIAAVAKKADALGTRVDSGRRDPFVQPLHRKTEGVTGPSVSLDELRAIGDYEGFLRGYVEVKRWLRDAKSRSEPADLKREAERRWSGAKRLVDTESLPLYSELVELAKDDELESMRLRLRRMEELRARPEFDEAETDVDRWLREARAVVAAAEARIELAKIPIAVLGTSISEEDSFARVRVGGELPSGLRIAVITRYGVTVARGGLLREVGLGK